MATDGRKATIIGCARASLLAFFAMAPVIAAAQPGRRTCASLPRSVANDHAPHDEGPSAGRCQRGVIRGAGASRLAQFVSLCRREARTSLPWRGRVIDKFVLAAAITIVAGIGRSHGQTTHCRNDEVVLFSALLEPEAKGRIVSLCADGLKNVQRLSYRFGRPGEIEMIFDAPNDGRFGVEGESSGIRSMIRTLHFERDDFTYGVAFHFTGPQDANVRVLVFKGKKLVASHGVVASSQQGSILRDEFLLIQDQPPVISIGKSELDFAK